MRDRVLPGKFLFADELGTLWRGPLASGGGEGLGQRRPSPSGKYPRRHAGPSLVRCHHHHRYVLLLPESAIRIDGISSSPQGRRHPGAGIAFGGKPHLAHLPLLGQVPEQGAAESSGNQRSPLLLQSQIGTAPPGKMWISRTGPADLARKQAREFPSKPDLPGLFASFAGAVLAIGRHDHAWTAFSCRGRKDQ